MLLYSKRRIILVWRNWDLTQKLSGQAHTGPILQLRQALPVVYNIICCNKTYRKEKQLSYFLILELRS